MTKENILYGIIGLLAGVIIGYVGTQTINRNYNPVPAAQMSGNQMSGGNAQQPAGGPPPVVMEALNKARNEPSNFEAQIQAADLYMQIGRYENALEFLNRAQQLKPNDFTVLSKLGNVNLDLERYEEAGKWYQAALKLKPDDVNVRTDLGASYYMRKPPQLDAAIAEYRASLKYDPRHEKTLHNLALALFDKGD
ncbi:MAG TPA: tetratricopeptide repeat protein, partial [Blastocatellia bacterium]|nr:tetratricopeptide repeat protein [Blastocatellia bacterium]